ncbi:MAG: 30S ribosomal protein S6 [bacterium]
MRFYECMLIVDAKTKEEDVEKLLKKVEKVVAKHGGGGIKEVTRLGLKRLAYPIDHKNEGIYYLVKLEIDPISIKGYEGIMKLSNIVLRFLTQKSTSPIPEPSVKEEKEVKELKEEEK